MSRDSAKRTNKQWNNIKTLKNLSFMNAENLMNVYADGQDQHIAL